MCKLLLVDDDPYILSSLRRILRRQPYQTLTAEDGPGGLELLARHEVAVVISDGRMGTMSGADFLLEVKRLYPTTVRIMLTGYTDREAAAEAERRCDLFRFMVKPWDDETLLDAIAAAMARYRQNRHHDDDKKLTVNEPTLPPACSPCRAPRND